MQLKYLILLFAAVGFLSSCDLGEEPVIEGVAIQEMTGEWWTTFTVGGEDIYGLGYNVITTYNTASNGTSKMWLDDIQHTWGYKLRVPINLEGRSFGGTDSIPELYFGVKAIVSNGVITKNDTPTTGGNTTDGITFDVEFSDDPGTMYHVEGYRRTGFQEDEH